MSSHKLDQIMEQCGQFMLSGRSAYPESSDSLYPHENQTISHDKNDKTSVKNFKNFMDATTFIKEIEKAMQCWIGSKVIRYNFYKVNLSRPFKLQPKSMVAHSLQYLISPFIYNIMELRSIS